jgi:hypothetical protein
VKRTVGSYRLAQCTRASLLIVRVPRGVDPKHAHHPLLTEFFRSGSSDPDDPRNAHKEQGVLSISDPLTLGLHEGSYVIGAPHRICRAAYLPRTADRAYLPRFRALALFGQARLARARIARLTRGGR